MNCQQPVNIIWQPSPNFDERLPESQVCFLIMHYTACDFKTALRHLTNGQAANTVSSHYLIAEDGTVMQLVDESKRAWHAGISGWQHYKNLNTWSIGIEIANMGHEPFAEKQIESLIQLSQNILKRHTILPYHVLGHADIALGRKIDPGRLFPWQRLADEGIGCYSQALHNPVSMDLSYVQSLLKKLGYQLEMTGQWDRLTNAAVNAFQMHYIPERVEPKIYPEMVTRLEHLVQMMTTQI